MRSAASLWSAQLWVAVLERHSSTCGVSLLGDLGECVHCEPNYRHNGVKARGTDEACENSSLYEKYH